MCLHRSISLLMIVSYIVKSVLHLTATSCRKILIRSSSGVRHGGWCLAQRSAILSPSLTLQKTRSTTSTPCTDNEPLNSIETCLSRSHGEQRTSLEPAHQSNQCCRKPHAGLCSVLNTWRKRFTKLSSVPSWNTVPAYGTRINKNTSISWKWLNAEKPDLWRTFPFDAANRPSLCRRWCLISDGNPCRLVARLHNRLTMMYKITNGLVVVSQEYHPAPRLQNSSVSTCGWRI